LSETWSIGAIKFRRKSNVVSLRYWVREFSTKNAIALLKMTEHVVNLYMHEVAMHVDHNVEEFKPPFTEANLRGHGDEPDMSTRPLSPAHIAALSTCLTSIDGIFEAFNSLEIDTIRCLPVLHFVRIAYAVVVLIKMYFAAATPNSEFGKVSIPENPYILTNHYSTPGSLSCKS
jgi:hypothetical protein